MGIIRKRKKSIRYTRGDYIFMAANWIILSVILIVLAYPLAFVIMSSISGGTVYMNLSLIPSKFSLEGYIAVFEHRDVWTGYRNSLIYTALFTVIALVVTICCAYPLSRKDFGGSKIIMALCIFTMYFSGGLIPTYLWIRQLRMLDTIWALLLPGSLSVFNMIVMRTYFATQIPDELHDAAMIDGCSDIRFLTRIVLPLSSSIIAVIALYYAVNMWNEYFNPMVYLTTRNKLPLPNFLREILMVNVQHALPTTEEEQEILARMELRADLMKYSLIIFASLPVMIMYPFVQKHFVKGALIGAVKG